MEVYYTTCISSLVYFCLYFESSDSIYQLVNINRREIPERKKAEGFNQTKKKKYTEVFCNKESGSEHVLSLDGSHIGFWGQKQRT